VRILARVDEKGFQAESSMGGDHPVTWCRTFEGGRAWMTLVGHDMQAFSNRDFVAHVRGGILWAGGWDVSTSIRGRVLTYAGKGGARLEVRLDGRRIEARRLPAPAR
jgi:type 1 glutamine amidotransferase